MICPSPSPAYQMLKRGACSDFVYHRLLISISEGATGFEDAKEDARGEEDAVIVGCGRAGGRDAPEDDVG